MVIAFKQLEHILNLKGILKMNTNVYWIVRRDSDKYRIFTRDKNSRPFIEGLNLLRAGKSLSEIWEKTVLLPLYSGDEGDEENEKKKPIPDFVKGIFGLAMNEKAYSTLHPLIATQAIFLELNTEVGLYYELDIQRIHCIDIENSEKALTSSGKILWIKKYNFYWEKIEGMHIFQPLDVMTYPDFVSNEFKQIVEKKGLTGLTFHPVPLIEQ